MPILPNGTPINGNVSSGDLSLGSITTTEDNCVIIVAVEQNAGDSGGTDGSAFFTSSSGLTYTRRGWSGGTPFLSEWVAIMPTAGTETITVHGGVGHGYLEATAAAFSGIDTTTLYDSNPTAGFFIGSNNEPGYLTTNNANDLLITVSRCTYAGADTGNGWTDTQPGTFLLFQHQIVSATGTYETTNPATHNGMIMDAFVAAGSPAKTKTMKVAVNSTDIAGPGPGSTSQPFLNIFKTGGEWGANVGATRYATSDGFFQLDADGYFTSMVTTGGHGTLDYFDAAFMSGFSDNASEGYYPGGSGNPYVFMWDGGEDGVTSFTFTDDAGGVSYTQSGGVRRKVFTVTPSGTGFRVKCTALGATPPTNMRLICSPGSVDGGTVGANEALHETSLQVVNPEWKTKLQDISCDRIRMMNWMNTNANRVTDFTGRTTLPSSAFWFGTYGVPMEAMVSVCNEVGCDLWINFPLLSTDASIEDMCDVVYGGTTDNYGRVWPGLDTAGGRRVCTEYFNECWIATRDETRILGGDYFDQDDTYYDPPTTDGFAQHFQFCLMRQIQTNNIFRAKWLGLGGSASKHVRVLAGNQGNRPRNEAFLMNGTTTGAGTGTTFTPFSFTTTNGSVSGTTFTPGAGLSGDVSLYQELTGSGVPAATYIEADNGDGTWELNHDCGTITSQAFSGDYWTGAVIQTGTNAYNKYFDEFCTATYFNGTQDGSEDETQFWIENDADLNGHCKISIANDCYSCHALDVGKGIPFTVYEGGQQYFASSAGAYDAAKDAVMEPAQYDYRMGLAYDNLLTFMDNGNVEVFCHYTEFGRKEQSGQLAVYWGALNSVYATPTEASAGVPGTPKWNSLVTFAGGVVDPGQQYTTLAITVDAA